MIVPLLTTPDGSRAARTVWLTGLPSAGKTTIGRALVERLRASGYPAELLDGDEVRPILSAGLGFSREDRDQNVKRIGYVADLLSRNGVWAVAAVVSPYRSARDEVRARHGDRFVEAWVATPAEVCAGRDVKGLYARQRSGGMAGLTGADDPYEPPVSPEAVLEAGELSVDECVDTLWELLELPRRQHLSPVGANAAEPVGATNATEPAGATNHTEPLGAITDTDPVGAMKDTEDARR